MANKYHARRVELDNITFDSIRESRHYQELVLRLRAGEIADLQVHVPYVLVVYGHTICTYVADFTYIETATNLHYVVDVKAVPTRTATYRLKRKLMKACYGIDVVEVM